MVYSVQFHLFIFAFFKRLRDCSALVKRRTDGRRQGEQPERCELSQKPYQKKEFAGGEEEEKERNPPLTCARAQIFLPLPTQFSGGKRNHLTWKLSFHL